MKLILNKREIEFSCKDDLAKSIPEGRDGKPLNYGQGEGQVRIEDTVWGFYVNFEGIYYMVFEEGIVEWPKLQELINEIVKALNLSFNTDMELYVEGPFTSEKKI